MTDPAGMAWMDDLVCAKEERDALADQIDQIREMLGIERDVDVAEALSGYLRQLEARPVRPADPLKVATDAVMAVLDADSSWRPYRPDVDRTIRIVLDALWGRRRGGR
jgi:hypothetical protein